MSSNETETALAVTSTARLTVNEIAAKVRKELNTPGTFAVIIDQMEKSFVVEREAEAQKQRELEDLARVGEEDSLDPYDVASNSELLELSGGEVRWQVLEALLEASAVNLYVRYWCCGDPVRFLKEFDIKVSRLAKGPMARLLHADVLYSESLGPGDVVACLTPSVDAVPSEVERGVLIRLGAEKVVGQAPSELETESPSWFGPRMEGA